MTMTVRLADKIREIENKPWHPLEVARVNDQVIRLALFRGEYHWHRHQNDDELIFVYKGQVTVQFRDKPSVELSAGEMAVIPKGVEHYPKSSEDSYVLMFEPASLETKGD